MPKATNWISGSRNAVFSALGKYRPAHDDNSLAHPFLSDHPRLPPVGERKTAENPPTPDQSRYASMRTAARNAFAIASSGSLAVGIPLVLICDYCGNIQYFRWDLADGSGKSWLP